MIDTIGGLKRAFIPMQFVLVSLVIFSCSQEQASRTNVPSKPSRSSSKSANSKKSKTKSACSDTKLQLLAGETYEKDIAPLINAKCAWCHSPDAAANRRRTPYLQTFELMRTRATDSISEMNGNSMPPNNVIPRIAAGDAALLQAWVNGGMIQGAALTAPTAPKAMTYNGFVKEYLRRNCTGCHSPQGGQAPDLSTFESAKGLVNASINSMTQRRMPPGLPAAGTAGVVHLQNWMTQGLLLDEPTGAPVNPPSVSPSPQASPSMSADPIEPVGSGSEPEHDGECAE
jgi:hypothetical protein